MGENVYWHCTEYDRRKQKALCVWLHTMLDRVGELPYAVIAGEALTIPAYQDQKTASAPQPATLLGLCIFPGHDDNSICFIWDTARNELLSFYPGWKKIEGESETNAESAEWRQEPVRHQVYTGTAEKPMQGRIRIGGETRAFSHDAISILPTIQALLPELTWESDYGALLHRNPESTESLNETPIPPAIQRYWDDLFEQFANE